jgi:glycosyltransferase involved in cell wall biosynthesis
MKISVIIPMYNEEDNVLRTLVEVNSAMKDYDDYEIVAVDDGSKDDTFRLAEEVSSHNSHIKVVKQPVNMGMGRALRTGFEKSEGNILVTIDADLSYSPSHINKLVSELLND